MKQPWVYMCSPSRSPLPPPSPPAPSRSSQCIFETALNLKKSCRFNTVYIPLMQFVSLHDSISLYYGTFVRAKKPAQVQCYYLNSRFHWIFTSFSTNDLFLLEDPIHDITLHLGLDEFLKKDNFISSLPLE